MMSDAASCKRLTHDDGVQRVRSPTIIVAVRLASVVLMTSSTLVLLALISQGDLPACHS